MTHISWISITGCQALSLILTQRVIKKTRILAVTVLATESVWTETVIVSQGVVTLTMHTGSLQSTLIDILLADVSSVPSVVAAAGVTIDSISAVATVETGGAGAVISVGLTVNTRETGNTVTLVVQ